MEVGIKLDDNTNYTGSMLVYRRLGVQTIAVTCKECYKVVEAENLVALADLGWTDTGGGNWVCPECPVGTFMEEHNADGGGPTADTDNSGPASAVVEGQAKTWPELGE